VDRPAIYSFELRRWPSESHLKLDEGAEATSVTDGKYTAGQPIAIATARIRIGDQEMVSRPRPDGESVQFRIKLPAGTTELQTWFEDGAQRPICGSVLCLRPSRVG
jgi:hypothetical protein